MRIRKVPLLPSRRRAKAKSSSGGGGNSNSGANAKNETNSTIPSPIVVPPTTPLVPKPGQNSTPSNILSEYDMPPAKREKLFDDSRLPNGTGGLGDIAYGESSRFGQYGQSSGLGHSFSKLHGQIL